MSDPILNDISSKYGLPIPSVYIQQENTADSQYQAALAQIAAQQAQTMASYGFKGGIDPNTGSVTNLSIDNSNPYNQVMSMLFNHGQQLNSLRSSLMGAGLGQTGLADQRQNLMHFINSGQTAGLGQNFQILMNSIFGQKAQALTDKNSAYNAAEQNALAYAIQNQLFNPAPPPPSTPPPHVPDAGPGSPGIPYSEPTPAGYMHPGTTVNINKPTPPSDWRARGLVDVPRLSNPIISQSIPSTVKLSPASSASGAAGVRSGATTVNYQAAARAV